MGEKSPKEVLDFISVHPIRMRDKLRQNGGSLLSRQELLEMLLYFNFRRGDVRPLIKSLHGRFETLDHILRAPAEELAGNPRHRQKYS